MVAAGGLPDKNKLLMQIYADVTGREMKIDRLGPGRRARLGHARRGGGGRGCGRLRRHRRGRRDTWRDLKDEVYRPIPEHKAVYDQLYAEYVRLYDYFGRGENDVMKTLKRIKAEAQA